MALLIQHPRGAQVEFAVCGRCVRALRRLAATTGGSAVFSISQVSAPTPATVQSAGIRARPAAPAELIAELTQELVDSGGRSHLVQVFGRERSDGTWEGWLEFVEVGTQRVLRTQRETTQSKRDDVFYWASGLEPSFVTGAFERALAPVTAPAR